MIFDKLYLDPNMLLYQVIIMLKSIALSDSNALNAV